MNIRIANFKQSARLTYYLEATSNPSGLFGGNTIWDPFYTSEAGHKMLDKQNISLRLTDQSSNCFYLNDLYFILKSILYSPRGSDFRVGTASRYPDGVYEFQVRLT